MGRVKAFAAGTWAIFLALTGVIGLTILTLNALVLAGAASQIALEAIGITYTPAPGGTDHD